MTKYTSKKQLVEALKSQLELSTDKSVKALMKIYERQTSDEKSSRETKVPNKVGFTASDAKTLSYDVFLLKHGYTLHPERAIDLRFRMQKYAGQLIDMSIESGKIRKENGVYVW